MISWSNDERSIVKLQYNLVFNLLSALIFLLEARPGTKGGFSFDGVPSITAGSYDFSSAYHTGREDQQVWMISLDSGLWVIDSCA